MLSLAYNKLNKPLSKSAAKANASDITHLQLHILEELYHTSAGISLTQLAKQIRISKQQLTPLIAKLEEKAYVLKTQDNADKRSIKLLLSEKGKTRVTEHWEEFHHLFSERVAGLAEDDRIDLDYAINKIIRIFGKMQT